jgi:chaperonin GroES
MSKLMPLAGYVVVKRLEEATQTKSGILLAESAKEKPQKGEVIAVGAGKDGAQPQVQPGQTVLFKKYGPVEVDVDGEELILLEEDEILAYFA